MADGDPVHFFGIPIKRCSYGSSILSTILIVLFLSYVERFAGKVCPNMVKVVLKPFITIAFTSLVFLILHKYRLGLHWCVLPGVIGFLAAVLVGFGATIGFAASLVAVYC